MNMIMFVMIAIDDASWCFNRVYLARSAAVMSFPARLVGDRAKTRPAALPLPLIDERTVIVTKK